MFKFHLDAAISLEESGKVTRPYRQNYEFSGWVNNEHRWYAECEMNGICIKSPIQGWLQAADALKLYELAYFSPGDIVEFGTYHGLSCSILAQAVLASARGQKLETVELDQCFSQQAQLNLKKFNLHDRVIFHVGDAERVCQQFIETNRTFSFIFVDHSHAYWPVYKLCKLLDNILIQNGLVLFHDYNDPRNTSEKYESDAMDAYGVYAAVHDVLPLLGYEFVGVYGCCGLFKKP